MAVNVALNKCSLGHGINADSTVEIGKRGYIRSVNRVCEGVFLIFVSILCFFSAGLLWAQTTDQMTEAEAARLGEEFGIVVGPVDEEIQRELKMQKPEGVVVFEVIGGTPADLAGIKVRAVIKEIDKVEVRTMMDFGKALKRAIPTGNFTVGTYEPADPEVQGVGGLINFHFVRIVKD